MRPFTVDDLLKLNQFAHRCPWDLSPDGALLAVALNEANRREPLGDESSSRTIHGVHLESNGAHLLLLDNGDRRIDSSVSRGIHELGGSVVARRDRRSPHSWLLLRPRPVSACGTDGRAKCACFGTLLSTVV